MAKMPDEIVIPVRLQIVDDNEAVEYALGEFMPLDNMTPQAIELRDSVTAMLNDRGLAAVTLAPGEMPHLEAERPLRHVSTEMLLDELRHRTEGRA